MERCPGCGNSFPKSDGGTHAYIGASAGCWSIYGEVLSREYADMRYFRVHGLTVDAYSAQHPGNPERRAIQSVAVHLLSLYAALELNFNQKMLIDTRKRASKSETVAFHRLEPPPSLGAVTVKDVHAAPGPEEHSELVTAWARSVWKAWETHHRQIRRWAEALGIVAAP